MSQFEILLPFALPPVELAGDLLRALDAPALALLLSRSQREDESFDAFERALPHEAWLARQFGADERLRIGGSPPVAAAAMEALGLPHRDGCWFMLQPAHLHVARDHLVLTDLRQLILRERESRALFEAIQPLLEESDKELAYGDAHTWFLRADHWQALRTATPDAASGHNIDIWLPQGGGERDWRKFQNEIQMTWHTHAVNAEREMHNMKPVNSAWLWGGTPAGTRLVPLRHTHAFNLPGWMQFLGRGIARHTAANASEVIAAAPASALVVSDALIEPALANDWSEWLARLQELESEWLAPLLGAVKAGKIDSVSLILTDGSRLSTYKAGKSSLRKFWLKPSLAKLLS